MPTYEYECSKCRRTFTAFQGIMAKPLKACSLCKKGPVKRLIGPGSGLLFKGTGFYITDYKKKGAPKKDGDSGSTGSTSGGKKNGDSGTSGSKSGGGPSSSKPEKT